ncbi:MAG: collagenase-like protease [Candidatus Dactylopiibacterium carminicum]|uniref:Collagenase-like protease n=1 Tax=Candidatus Dactylopiibacterium carminicum TaxID=857335 RepID=A0A272EXE5_9RHOO|nr:U32 family peptidase [Candidatus Dactylopiibacterium carminicum]KAF7600187.1 collagenase-like protease [Candidatus Dactylopiibacterium carminicum]PAS94794.1 MAG: collagenase-like protease [Candidatus Dactylopiibacterium carminicum]PAT00188.1 MAG: protease [Candidatus Dactylopiibacterium carminicum]
MSLPRHHLELLAPAKTTAIGREAILHGADAVYIGGPSFGARAAADNPVSEIADLVGFAHRFGARIFVTLNTILHDTELAPARRLVHELYDAGVDALIVQDMGLLEIDLPPIALHASTQCDIRSVKKTRFLGAAGFSQLVLARELTLDDITAIRAAVNPAVPLEFFIHGALCVAFSGQCYISHAHTGRSANRGDCSQACRLPYTLADAQGRVVAYDKHLLSMKDNNQSANLRALVDAGVQSFKIEGRYKDMGYVKNITAHYRQLLDEILTERPELAKSSHGSSTFAFRPDPDKTFNRSSTDYFVQGRKADIGAFDAPSHEGQRLGVVTRLGVDWFELESGEALANGDGLSWLFKRRLQGAQADRVQDMGQGLWRVMPHQKIAELPGLAPGCVISRNRDHACEQVLQKPSAERRIALDLHFGETTDGFALRVMDESGAEATARLTCDKQPAQHPEKSAASLHEHLSKLGATIFTARTIGIDWQQPWFLPASQLNALRRDAIEALEVARAAALGRPPRFEPATPPAVYPEESLSYLANVYNEAARRFYARHGVSLMASAYEAHEEAGEASLMITKHCLRFAFNLCPKQAKGVTGVQGQVRAEPMTLINGKERLTLRFDCKPCEMHVIGKIKPQVLRSPPPGSPIEAPVSFHRRRPA